MSVNFEIKVTAKEARQQVDRWLHQQVSMLISADKPELVIGKKVVWRVPAYISFPHVGRAGNVGIVDVDVNSGKIHNMPAVKAKIEANAQKVAQQQPSYQPKRTVPSTFISKHLPSAPNLILPENKLT